MMSPDPNEARWRKHAASINRSVNLGWWLETFAPALVGLALLAACTVLALRSYSIPISPGIATLIGGGALLFAGFGCYLAARHHFRAQAQSLVHLESRLGLHNALSAAASGNRPWPEAPEKLPSSYQWRWQRLCPPALIALALVVASLLVPVATQDAHAKRKTSEPSAWGEVEEMITQLEEEEVIDQASLDQIEERIAELRAQPTEEWYSHSSLEAGDHERATMENNLRDLAANLDKSSRTLQALEKFGDQINSAAMERLLKEFGEGIEGMKANPMEMDKKLLKALEGIDPSLLKTLSKTQLAKLREQLEKRSGTCKSCLGKNGKSGKGAGEGTNWAEMEEAELLALINGKSYSARGTGGVQRGPGTAPITLANEESNLDTQNLEGVTSDDLSRALPSDVIGMSQGEHDLNKQSTSPINAGKVNTLGQGGQTVWKDTLLPSEKKVLKRYFD